MVVEVPLTTPPLVVLVAWGVGVVEGVGETEGMGEEDSTGASSKLGSTEAEGVGDVRTKLGSLIVPRERRIIKPIAPTIIAATRPEVNDFMSYILYLEYSFVKCKTLLVQAHSCGTLEVCR